MGILVLMFELSKGYFTPLVESESYMAKTAGHGMLFGVFPVQRTTISELEWTRGIRLFNQNRALRWPQKVLAQCDFCPVL